MNCGKWRVMAVSFFKPPPFIYRIYTHCRIYSYSLACFQKFVIVTLYNLWLGCCRKEGRVCFYIQSTLHRVRLQCLIAYIHFHIHFLSPFCRKKKAINLLWQESRAWWERGKILVFHFFSFQQDVCFYFIGSLRVGTMWRSF